MHADISTDHLHVPPRGIRSLAQRIQSLEIEKEIDDNLITRLQKAEKEMKNKELSKLNELFVIALEENVQDLDKNNLVEIISFANLFVKQNIANIAILCNSRVTDEFVTLAIISMVLSKYPSDDLEFMQKTVKCVRKLMNTEDVQQEFTPKKSIFSIGKSKRSK